jgi:site-specific recombinase XerD
LAASAPRSWTRPAVASQHAEFIGKGRKQRSVALPERARAVIRQYVAATVGEPHDPLIRKEDGSRAAVTYMIVYRCVLRWTQRHLGVRLTPHKLRHAYGKNCVDLGADIRVISEALGHESLDSTRIYTQVSFERTRADDESQEDAVSVEMKWYPAPEWRSR